MSSSRPSKQFAKRYQELQSVREGWFRTKREFLKDRSDVVVELDGSQVHDVPTLWLALGEAVNGPGGYYGGGLDALSDCLCGEFGIVSPFTLRIVNTALARKALDRKAWLPWQHEWQRSILTDPSFSAEARVELGIPLGKLPADTPPYFDEFIEVLEAGGVSVVCDDITADSPHAR